MTKIPDRKANALREAASRYDIGENTTPEAVFSLTLGTLMVWCIPDDNPGGLWNQVKMRHSSLSQLTKPASGLAYCGLLWSMKEQDLVGLSLQTNAHKLVSAGLISESEKENRPEDLAWAKRKLMGICL